MFSGAAALAYEICWSRALVVPLGNSMDAAALVLAGFMLGIALGARFAGNVADRSARPLRIYALVEVALGGYALAAPALLAATTSLGVGVRYAAALVLITAPGMAMGASLPLLVRALTSSGERVGRHISVAYGANTAGAALGACLTGFWGIAALGLWRCSGVAAGASLVAAAIALVADRYRDALAEALTSVDRKRASALPQPIGDAGEASPSVVRSHLRDALPEAPASDPHAAPRGAGIQSHITAAHARRLRQVAVGVAFVSGFAMLAGEMLWARVLTFVFGHDTYAFAALLAIVLSGLALGGFLHRLFAAHDQRRVIVALLAGFGVALLLSFWASAELVIELGRDPFGLMGQGAFATSVWLELYRELAYTPVLVLLPSVLSGAIFPAACSLYGGERSDAGMSVGVVTLVNGIGSACGALIVSAGLIAWVGIQHALALVALLLGSAAMFAVAWPRQRRRGMAAVALLPLAAVLMLGVAMPRQLPREMLLATVGARHQSLLFYREARTSTVSVIVNAVNQERQLLINAVNEVTTRLVHDQSFKFLGHLAPLLHPSPRRGLMICLGAGMSAGAAAQHPLERLDVVDLSSDVASAARYFSVENNGVLDHPVLKLHIGDGRQYLLNTQDRFDVAIVDSTHPKSVDSWILYTESFYLLLRERLADDGIAVQWLPLHGLSELEFKIIVRTFQAAFPEMTLWANAGVETYGQVAYAKLVGSKRGALTIDGRSLSARLADPRIGGDLAKYGVSSLVELLDLFVAGPRAVAAWTDGLPIQTDDHPVVPYTTPYAHGRRMVPDLLLAARSPVEEVLLPGSFDHVPGFSDNLSAAVEAQGMVLAGHLDRALSLRPHGTKIKLYVEQHNTTMPYYVALTKLYDDDTDKLFEFGTQLGNLGFPDASYEVYRVALSRRSNDFKIRLNHALLLLGRGDNRGAVEILAQLRAEEPRSPIVLHNLGAAVLASGEANVAAAHLEEAVARDPGSIAARITLARAYIAGSELARASTVLNEVIARNAFVGDAHDLLGIVASLNGAHEAAASHHERATELEPYRAKFHFHLARARHRLADQRAAESYRRAMWIDPQHTLAMNELGRWRRDNGDYEGAADLHLQVLDLDPQNAFAAHHLGLALRGQGRPSEAVGAFCLALRLQPRLAAARHALGAMGRPQACREWQ